jgi:pimeloyl-ACP methyl ester carboxylesterase
MEIVYIHGANASSETFTYIRDHLPEKEILFDYASSNGFKNNLKSMKERLNESTEEIFFIAHSLGGIYAYYLANEFAEKTIGGVTISTPYGGSRHADWMRMVFPLITLYRDIGPNSSPIANLSSLNVPKNWLNVVSTKGSNPWMHEPNDSVVTIASMKAIAGVPIVEVPLNHYEVVVSKQVLGIIHNQLYQQSR